MRVLILITALWSAASCNAEAEIAFRVCGKLKVPAQVDALRIAVLDEQLEEKRAALIELTARPAPTEAATGGRASAGAGGKRSAKDAGAAGSAGKAETQSAKSSNPTQSLPVEASLPVPNGAGYVRVQALLNGSEVARFERRITELDKIKHVDMPLSDACYGKTNCEKGQTCVTGDCTVAPINAASPHCD